MRGMSGKWKAMWHSSPFPKYGSTSGGHWLASARKSRLPCRRSISARSSLRIACVSGRFSQIEPEAHHALDGADDRRAVVVEVRLVAEETMPVVLLRALLPRPVARLGI